MNNVYILVDHEKREIVGQPIDLPENWRNIHGTNALSEEELYDLSWAGHQYIGLVKYNSKKISTYSYTEDWLDLAKQFFKVYIADKRWESQSKDLNFKAKFFKFDESGRSAMSFKLMTLGEGETVNWKFKNGYKVLEGDEFKEMTRFANDYCQQCFDVEMEFQEKVNAADTLKDIQALNLDIDWPAPVYSV